MPVNVLKKNTPRGNGPPPTSEAQLAVNKQLTEEDKQKEADLAAEEMQALWESQEEGITRWSESDGKRYAD